MTGEPNPAVKGTKTDKKRNDTLFCPFLGFEDDPTTALAYPAKLNFCFRAKPAAPVSLAHQRDKCLTEFYVDCPVFQSENPIPLPESIRGERKSKTFQFNWVPLVALIAVVIIGLVALLLTGVFTFRGFTPPLADISTATHTPAHLPVVPLSAEPTTTVEATATLVPTVTATWLIPGKHTPRALETPFGTSPQLVIHKVAAGEGFILLAEKFHTTADAIKAINYQLPDSLWENTLLVIPVNTDDVAGLPAFSVVEIRAEGMTIESYAARMQLDVEMLKKYNDLPEGYSFQIGEMLIVPMTE
ncbi:MAG TPA: hypothetical protein PKZ26_02940 [Anaerolineaceae bacterium]|nr:hypothetical protein [Anaerolineaceae bacterium]HOS53975.1 hypothetical protein [Anaerolineaceae bacterium]HPD62123.1 hypothetical protein [Anaerolineaceae bacterium]HQF69575.1 hypothetical protein [Anaerolineaceae bacterium]HRS74356.1 hypothetical protein [Anaerolineaceae bacterium]